MSNFLSIIIMASSLTIVSYNSQGNSPSRIKYIDKLLSSNDFVFIQEHYLWSCQVNTFVNQLSNANIHCVSGINDYELIHGRPYGGVPIFGRQIC